MAVSKVLEMLVSSKIENICSVSLLTQSLTWRCTEGAIRASRISFQNRSLDNASRSPPKSDATMQRYWEDDSVRDSTGRVGRIIRAGWDEDQAAYEPAVRASNTSF